MILNIQERSGSLGPLNSSHSYCRHDMYAESLRENEVFLHQASYSLNLSD